ncbi:PepSY-like domain-containing protein [Melioribacteraceae bacterium 4301-Me]|uniref:PepSY-like domain-containing protein n=1 Tax=Pyranulibacter aquaticus TaxID=3163344 RepID=UPI003596D2BA
MKAKNLLIAFLFFSFTAFAQQVNIPKAAKDSFSKLYPKATEVKWDKEKQGYEASFKLNGKDMSVIFDKEGKVVETETAIEISQLPKGVEKYVMDNYKGFKITGAAKIIKANGEELFEAEITKGKNSKDLLFDKNGKAEKKDVNKEKENESEDKEDED